MLNCLFGFPSRYIVLKKVLGIFSFALKRIKHLHMRIQEFFLSNRHSKQPTANSPFVVSAAIKMVNFARKT